MHAEPASIRFPLLACFKAGLGLFVANMRPLALMCLVPFLVYAGTLIVQRLLPYSVSPLIAAVSLLPANFLLGVVMALALRWFVLGEHPATENDPENIRNLNVRDAGVAAAAVTFFSMGVSTAVLYRLEPALHNAQAGVPANAEDSLFSFIVLGLMLWAGRFLWLSAPLALGFDVRGFFKALGGFAGSVRILALFMFCNMLASLPFDVLRNLVLAAAGGVSAAKAPAPIQIIDSFVLAGSNIAQGLLFACATAAALRFSLKKDVTT